MHFGRSTFATQLQVLQEQQNLRAFCLVDSMGHYMPESVVGAINALRQTGQAQILVDNKEDPMTVADHIDRLQKQLEALSNLWNIDLQQKKIEEGVVVIDLNLSRNYDDM